MKKSDSINVRISKAQRQALEQQAAKEEEFQAEIVRRAIDAYCGPSRMPQKSTD